MDDVFTPALMERGDGYLPGRVKKTPWDSPNWLDVRQQGTPAYYPNALIAYPHWVSVTHRPFPKDGYLFGDSGGFSIQTLKLSIDPCDVMRWQLNTKCTAGALLDHPPSDKQGVRFFAAALATTMRYTERALPLYQEHREKGGAFRWWGVVHGWAEQDMGQWYDTIRRVYPFADQGEGWAFKPRPRITPPTVARCLHFIQERPEIRRAHFLMVTGASSVATLMALGEQAGLDLVSYDSTTFTLLATNRVVLIPRGLDWGQMLERGAERHVRDYLLTKCLCSSCEQLRGDAERYPGLLAANTKWTGYWVYRFAYHNLLTILEVFGEVREAVRTAPEATLREILFEDYGPTMRAFEGRETFTETTPGRGSLLDHI